MEPLRIALTHECRADAIAPAEMDLKPLLESLVSIPNNAGQEEKSPQLTFVEDGPTQSDGPLHLAVHLGGFLSIEHILKIQAYHMLDLLARDDSLPESWMSVLDDTEAKLREAYRSAFNSPSVRQLLCRTGNVFISGQGEVGGASVMMLCSTRPERSESENTASYSNNTNAISDLVVVARDRLVAEAEVRSAAQEELRELMMAALLRVARRVNWLYMRQTWQDSESFEDMIKNDSTDEEMHRSVSFSGAYKLSCKTFIDYCRFWCYTKFCIRSESYRVGWRKLFRSWLITLERKTQLPGRYKDCIIL